MNSLQNLIRNDSNRFYLSAAAFALGLISMILYLAAGIIPGYSTGYSTGVLAAVTIGLAGNVLFTFKRVDTLEIIPFVSYIIAIIFFVASNVDYLTAVIRAIDVSRVETTFVLTILLLFLAAVLYAVSFVAGGKTRRPV